MSGSNKWWTTVRRNNIHSLGPQIPSTYYVLDIFLEAWGMVESKTQVLNPREQHSDT